MGALILLFTLISVYRQIGHVQEQNELQRNVASKSAIQELNKVLLDEDQEEFLRFVFLKANEKKDALKEAQESMMAFSLMNSLEMLYLTQKERVSRDDFKRLLRNFTVNVREIWEKDKNFATVYHPDFQKIVKEVFAEQEERTP